MTAQESTSTRPYLIRALYEWCTDNGLTPYVAVRVDDSVQVPREYVKDGEIVVPVGRVIAIYARENGQGMAFPPPVDVLAGGAAAAGAIAPMLAEAVSSEDATAASGAQTSEDRVVQLVSADDGRKDGDEGGDAPRPPPAAGGARPSLKRVK